MLADVAVEGEKHSKPNMTYRMIWLIAILVIIGIFVVAAIIKNTLKSKPFIPQNNEVAQNVQPSDPLGLSYVPEPDIHLAGNEMLRTDGTHSIFQ
jgi:flagellar basal body-associated protein FliL